MNMKAEIIRLDERRVERGMLCLDDVWNACGRQRRYKPALGERDLRPTRAARPSALDAAYNVRGNRGRRYGALLLESGAGLASANTRTLNAMGYYEDFCVKFDGRWLIKEKGTTVAMTRRRCRGELGT